MARTMPRDSPINRSTSAKEYSCMFPCARKALGARTLARRRLALDPLWPLARAELFLPSAAETGFQSRCQIDDITRGRARRANRHRHLLAFDLLLNGRFDPRFDFIDIERRIEAIRLLLLDQLTRELELIFLHVSRHRTDVLDRA